MLIQWCPRVCQNIPWYLGLSAQGLFSSTWDGSSGKGCYYVPFPVLFEDQSHWHFLCQWDGCNKTCQGWSKSSHMHYTIHGSFCLLFLLRGPKVLMRRSKSPDLRYDNFLVISFQWTLVKHWSVAKLKHRCSRWCFHSTFSLICEQLFSLSAQKCLNFLGGCKLIHVTITWGCYSCWCHGPWICGPTCWPWSCWTTHF